MTARLGEIKLGDRVKFRLNGFEGICDGVTDYLYQCRQIHIVPEKLDKDNKQVEGHWYDEPWVDIVKAGAHAPVAAVMAMQQTTTRQPAHASGGPNRSHPKERV
jgi:hypothetical protein